MSLDTTTGRWLEQDPAGYIDGPNIYQFEESNPVNNLDPTGTCIYSWTVASATAKLNAQLAAWAAKPGYGLQSNLLKQFLSNTGKLYTLNDHPADLTQVQNDTDFQAAISNLIENSIRNSTPGVDGKVFAITGVDDHYFLPGTDLFWAFASLHIKISGLAIRNCDGSYAYHVNVTFSKNWNFNHGHFIGDNLFTTFDAGQFLEDNGAGKAFGLNGWYKTTGTMRLGTASAAAGGG